MKHVAVTSRQRVKPNSVTVGPGVYNVGGRPVEYPAQIVEESPLNLTAWTTRKQQDIKGLDGHRRSCYGVVVGIPQPHCCAKPEGSNCLLFK